MSRTYRKGIDWKYQVNGHRYDWDDVDRMFGAQMWRLAWGWTLVGRRDKKMRDGNTSVMSGPPKWYKRLNRREERRKMDAAIRDDRDMPRFRTRDRYEWW